MAVNTWVGVTDNLWGATPGAASLNWSTGLVPDATDDLIIDATAPADVVLNGDAVCKSLTTTGYTSVIYLVSYDLDVIEDMTFESASGGLQGDGSVNDITVGGNLLITAAVGSISIAMTWDVTGTAVAHDIAISNQDFSAGTALNASDDCLDPIPGSNANVTFGALVWDGSVDETTTDAANWTPAEAPHLERDARINAAAPGDVTGDLAARSIDFTGFVGAYSGSINVYGNLTLAAGMTVDSQDSIDFWAAASLTSNGQTVGFITVNDGAGTLTLLDDLKLTYCDVQNGGALAMGSHTMTIDLVDGDEEGWYIDSTAGLTYSAGAKWIGKGEPGTLIDLETENPAVTAPPVEISEGAQLYIGTQAAKMTSLIVTGGGIYFDGSPEIVGDCTIIGGILTNDGSSDNMNGKTLQVGGDLDISDVDVVTAGNIDCAGTATIHDATVSNMTATGPVNCLDGCIDGGGNDLNYQFTVKSWDGSESTDNNDADNWTPSGAPNQSNPVLFDGTATDDINGGTVTCASLDTTGYTFDLNETTFDVFGNIILSPSVAPASRPVLNFRASGSLQANGAPQAKEVATRADISDVDVTLLDDLATREIIMRSDGGVIFLGDNIVTFELQNDEDGFYIRDGSFCSFLPGAKLIGLVDADGYLDIGTGIDDTNIAPPVEISGGGQFYNDGEYAKMQSLLITGGGAYFNAAAGSHETATVETVEDLTIIGGVITSDGGGTSGGNQLIIVGGDLDISGVAVIEDLRVQVVGSGAFHDATVSNVDASGGSEIDATDNCVDGGGNTNVDFGIVDVDAPTVTNVTSALANGTYASGQVLDIQVVGSENLTVTGTPQLALQFANAVRQASYLSGSGSDTLVFRYTAVAADYTNRLDYVGATSLTLNGGSIKDGAGNDLVRTLPAIGVAGSLGVNKSIAISNATGYVARTHHRGLGQVR